jgi:hypothetical protein
MADGSIVLTESNFILASYGAVEIGVVDGPTSVDQINAFVTHLRSGGQRNPNGFALMFIIRAGAQLPSAEVRSRFELGIRAQKGKLKVLVGVIEGSGFATATKRSVFTMIATTGLMGHLNVKVLADVPKACAWLAAEGPALGVPAPPAGELAAFAAKLPETTDRPNAS